MVQSNELIFYALKQIQFRTNDQTLNLGHHARWAHIQKMIKNNIVLIHIHFPSAITVIDELTSLLAEREKNIDIR